MIAGAVHEDDAVVNQRSGFVGAWEAATNSRRIARLADVDLVDLFERAEALVVIGAAPGQPFAGRRILKVASVTGVSLSSGLDLGGAGIRLA